MGPAVERVHLKRNGHERGADGHRRTGDGTPSLHPRSERRVAPFRHWHGDGVDGPRRRCCCCCSCCCCSCSCLAPVFDARGRRVFLAAREAQREVVWSRPNRVGSRTLQRAEDDPWKDARGPWSVSRGVLDVQLEAGVGDGGAVEDEREEEEEEDEEEA